MWTQLKPFNPNINVEAGDCYMYQRMSFGLPAIEPSAWAAWENAKYKHADRNFPSGVSVPIFFDWSGTINGVYARYGHAAVMSADGKVYSSPLSGAGHAWFNSIDDLIRAFGGTMTYVGWTEDIANIRVIKENTMSEDAVRMGILGVTGGQPLANYEKEVKYWTGRTPDEFCKYLYGLGDYYALALRKENDSLKKQLLQSDGTFTETDRATLTETNNIIKSIWTKITSVFK